LFLELYVLHFRPTQNKNYASVAWNCIMAADANELVRIQKVIAYLAYGSYGHAIPIHKLIGIEYIFQIEAPPFYPTLLMSNQL
jgi:hypothetical protein